MEAENKHISQEVEDKQNTPHIFSVNTLYTQQTDKYTKVNENCLLIQFQLF